MEGTATISPSLKSLTFSPVFITLATASCPRIRLSGFFDPEPYTVFTSDVHTDTATGVNTALYGLPSTGLGKSIISALFLSISANASISSPCSFCIPVKLISFCCTYNPTIQTLLLYILNTNVTIARIQTKMLRPVPRIILSVPA